MTVNETDRGNSNAKGYRFAILFVSALYMSAASIALLQVVFGSTMPCFLGRQWDRAATIVFVVLVLVVGIAYFGFAWRVTRRATTTIRRMIGVSWIVLIALLATAIASGRGVLEVVQWGVVVTSLHLLAHERRKAEQMLA